MSPDPALPSDEILGALLRAAASSGAEDRAPDFEETDVAPAPDVLRRLAADDPGLRSLLAEVSRAWAEVEEAEPTPLSPHVRAAALAAWHGAAATLSPVRPVPRKPVSRWNPAPAWRIGRAGSLIRVAALLVVGLGVALLFAGSREARAGIRVSALYRLDLAEGRPQAGTGRFLAVGERIDVGPHEVLGLRLDGHRTVVLFDGGTLVARASQEKGRAVLGLEAGAVCLATRDGPVRLGLAGRGVFVLLEGRAFAAESGEIALGPASRGRLLRADGSVEDLEGPVHGVVGEGGLEGIGVPSPDLFRPLAYFGSGASCAGRGRVVEARRWRVLSGVFRRIGGGLSLEPAAPDEAARVAWRPSSLVRRARRLRVLLDAPEGTHVDLPVLGVGAVSGPAPKAAAGGGLRSVELSLPAGWYERLGEGAEELVLEFRVPAGGAGEGAGVRFEGGTFLFAAGRDTPVARSEVTDDR